MDLIDNKYRVLKRLGHGAMGEVFLVLPPRGDPVALKLLKSVDTNKKTSNTGLDQFENEFRTLKRLSHPNIGQIYDYGFDPRLKKVYFTSPWLKGHDLFTASKDLDFNQCENLFIQLLRAVNYLHQKGVIHCDLKPANIFVQDGHLILIDFGLADYWGESVVGTPTYLAPEIFRGERHHITSDLYAIGVIFYNCLTRIQPFSGESIQEVYDRHRTHSPLPISKLNGSVPEYFNDITQTLLAKKASERYQNAAAVIEEISAYSQKQYAVETQETLLSYLPTSSEMIGRAEIKNQIDQKLAYFFAKDCPINYLGIFLTGDHGIGRSQLVRHIKSTLQLNKVSVDEVILPLTEADQQILSNSRAMIIEDLDNYYLKSAEQEFPRPFREFLSFLEQKVLSPQTQRFIFIASSLNQEFDEIAKLFPQEEFENFQLNLKPFTREETRLFLESVIGQSDIPDEFIMEIHRNTGGNPGICQQIIEALIQKGFLFDETGRWSPDLLGNLEKTLRKIETPKSLIDQLKFEYDHCNSVEKEIIHWLITAPQGLSIKALTKLTQKKDTKRRLKQMVERKILRQENDLILLYRSIFVHYLRNQLPLSDQHRLHDQIVKADIKLDQNQIWYHQSQSGNKVIAQSALESLGESFKLSGNMEAALECYQKLNHQFIEVPLPQKISWAIKASEILIWLDRFDQALEILNETEEAMQPVTDDLPIKSRLALWEKKGLALLHRQMIKEASYYFAEGARIASQNEGQIVEEIRFQNNLAQIEQLHGNDKQAIQKFLRTRAIAQKLDAEKLKLITNNDLGHLYFKNQNFKEAIRLLKEDTALFSDLPYKEPYARALYTLAESYRCLNRFSQALSEYQRCIATCRENHILSILIRAYNGLGNVYHTQEQFDEALNNYQKAIEISVHLKDPVTKAALLANQGLIYHKLKNYPHALRRYLLAKQTLEGQKLNLAYQRELLYYCFERLVEISIQENNMLKALSFQLELTNLVDKITELKKHQFEAHHQLAELYLENRLFEPLQSELERLTKMAATEQDKQKTEHISMKFERLKNADMEITLKVG